MVLGWQFRGSASLPLLLEFLPDQSGSCLRQGHPRIFNNYGDAGVIALCRSPLPCLVSGNSRSSLLQTPCQGVLSEQKHLIVAPGPRRLHELQGKQPRVSRIRHG